ncbi:hypothetical protein [Frankia sp. Cppng1_Ct_nod]|uniref:hypothetical protein n=1 Tax=Frankia sp. Cppng1_Ct_nod TaxID=2897162 RepID=UPI001041BBB7|nr:hypothetical protein [Frankia sp. Cppng1_Ct_nod]
MENTGIVDAFVCPMYRHGLEHCGAAWLPAAVTFKRVLALGGSHGAGVFADGPVRVDGAARQASATAGLDAARRAADSRIQARAMHPTLNVPGPPRGLLLA